MWLLELSEKTNKANATGSRFYDKINQDTTRQTNNERALEALSIKSYEVRSSSAAARFDIKFNLHRRVA